MRNLIQNHKGVLLLLGATLLIAIIIGIFAALAEGEKASLAENTLEGIAAPGQTVIAGTGNWFTDLFSYFGSVKALREENAALKSANVELDKRLRSARGLEIENVELRAMLEMEKTESKLELVAAPVIAKDPSNWYSTFTISRGSNHGIKEGQAVLTANKELVGKISRVGANWAEVMTLLDPECGVGASVARSQDSGVLEGDSSLRFQGRCRLGYLSRDTEIEPGDYLETSGMGDVYPKGLLIGRVLELKEDNTNMSRYAIVEPIVNFSKLHQVFVLLNSVEVIARAEEDPEMMQDKTEEDTNKEEEDEDKPTATSRPTATPKSTATSTNKPTATPKPTQRPTPTPLPTTDRTGVGGQELRE